MREDGSQKFCIPILSPLNNSLKKITLSHFQKCLWPRHGLNFKHYYNWLNSAMNNALNQGIRQGNTMTPLSDRQMSNIYGGERIGIIINTNGIVDSHAGMFLSNGKTSTIWDPN